MGYSCLALSGVKNGHQVLFLLSILLLLLSPLSYPMFSQSHTVRWNCLCGRSPRNWNPRNRVAQMAPPLIRMIRCCTNHHLMECYGIVWMGTPCIFCSTLVALCFGAGRISAKGRNKEGCSLHLQQGSHHTSNKFLEPLNSRLSIKRIYNRISLKWNKILQHFRAIFAKKLPQSFYSVFDFLVVCLVFESAYFAMRT